MDDGWKWEPGEKEGLVESGRLKEDERADDGEAAVELSGRGVSDIFLEGMVGEKECGSTISGSDRVRECSDLLNEGGAGESNPEEWPSSGSARSVIQGDSFKPTVSESRENREASGGGTKDGWVSDMDSIMCSSTSESEGDDEKAIGDEVVSRIGLGEVVAKEDAEEVVVVIVNDDDDDEVD